MEETQAVISGGEKEVSNPFLEKSAITYDKENEENRKQQEYIYTYSGDALDYGEVYKYTTKNDAKIVIVAGEHASGKTMLEVMMYRMFLEGKNNLLQFCRFSYDEGISGKVNLSVEKVRKRRSRC